MSETKTNRDQPSLDTQVNKAAFYSAVVLLLVTVPSLLFPLDAPEGPFADRMIWFSSNLGAFVAGWVVQMIAVLTLTGVYAGVAWHIRHSHPLRAFVAGTASWSRCRLHHSEVHRHLVHPSDGLGIRNGRGPQRNGRAANPAPQRHHSVFPVHVVRLSGILDVRGLRSSRCGATRPPIAQRKGRRNRPGPLRPTLPPSFCRSPRGARWVSRHRGVCHHTQLPLLVAVIALAVVFRKATVSAPG